MKPQAQGDLPQQRIRWGGEVNGRGGERLAPGLEPGLTVGTSLTSPRLRGEVGICALFAQIPGEGASPRV